MANELVKFRKKDRKPFKIGMEKAYDYVNWSFVEYMFDRMDFGHRWRIWMKTCVENTSYPMLVNGSPIDPIVANRD